jgi:transcriptional regulator with XRE-family HTH domain
MSANIDKNTHIERKLLARSDYFCIYFNMNFMKSAVQIDIISRIKKLRELHEFSQADMAKLLGISTGQMGNIESLRRPHKYTLSQIFIICNEFKFPIEHIFLNEYDYNANIDIVNLLIHKIVEYEQ